MNNHNYTPGNPVGGPRNSTLLGSAPNPPSQGRVNPFSPFAFGSPIARSNRSVLNPGGNPGGVVPNVGGDDLRQQTVVIPSPRVRLRGRELYGGQLMFGGANNATMSTTSFLNARSAPGGSTSLLSGAKGASVGASNASLRRSNRLLASAPYNAANRSHFRRTEQAPPVPQQPGTSGGSSPASTSSTASAASAVNLSATARSILETLEKMSTPLKDAHKIPIPRAEKRKAIAEELLEGVNSPSVLRRRPRLGGAKAHSSAPNTPFSNSARLNGPPLRKMFSPVGPRSQQPAPKLTTLTPRSSTAHQPSSTVTSKVASKVAFNVPALGGVDSSSSFKSSPSSLNPAPSSSNPTSSEKSLFSGLPAFAPKPTLSSNIPSGSMAAPSAQNSRLLQISGSEPSSKQSTGGKIKSKVTEKGRSRAEKGLGDGAEVGNEVPDYLKNASSLPSLPMVSNKTLPSFQFNEPSKLKEEVKPKPSVSTSPAPTNNASVNFKFGKPEVLKTSFASSTLSNSGLKFSFSLPQGLSAAQPTSAGLLPMKTHIMSTEAKTSNLPDLTSGHSKSQTGFSFGAMKSQSKTDSKPVSNGLFSGGLAPASSMKAGSVMDVLGGGSKLPDVARSTGAFQAAPSLKNGSVMDILGNSSSSTGTSGWSSSLGGMSKKPWQ